MPYFPGKSGRGPLINKMSYWDAVLYMSIVWISCLLVVWTLNYYRSENKFSKIRKYFRKRKLSGEVINKSKGIFKSYENIIETNIGSKLNMIFVDKGKSSNINLGDKIEVEFEERTNTVLGIKKL